MDGCICDAVAVSAATSAQQAASQDLCQIQPLSAVQGADKSEESEFAIVFAAMGVNMETAHFFKQVSLRSWPANPSRQAFASGSVHVTAVRQSWRLSAPEASQHLKKRTDFGIFRLLAIAT